MLGENVLFCLNMIKMKDKKKYMILGQRLSHGSILKLKHNNWVSLKIKMELTASNKKHSFQSISEIFTFFSWLGMIQRTKLGLVLRNVVINLASCSLYNWLTVRNMPLRVRDPNMVSTACAAPIPTMSANENDNNNDKLFTLF